MPSEDNVAVIGGSIAGLLAAREIAAEGHRVDVYEEDLEIGVPDHCGGLVSLRCLSDLGITVTKSLMVNKITRALLHSPGGVTIEIDARRSEVVALSRRALDREVAHQSAKYGAQILVGSKVSDITEREGYVELATRTGLQNYNYAIDAAGFRSYISRKKDGLMQSAQYEAQGKWFEEGTVELFFNNDSTPGFFAWVIPVGDDVAKVGVAGEAINSFQVLDQFLAKRKSIILKKLAAPIITTGPISSFRYGRTLVIGDAAGQTKPTTAGGIYTGGMGGLLAGRAVVAAIENSRPSELGNYERQWRQKFDREFRIMLLGRQIFRRLTNRQLDEIFSEILSSDLPHQISEEGDFDFHSISIIRALGLKSVLSLSSMILGAGVKTILSFGNRQRQG